MTIEPVDFKLVEKSAERKERDFWESPLRFVYLCSYIFAERFINFLVHAIDMKILASEERLCENSSRVKM